MRRRWLGLVLLAPLMIGGCAAAGSSGSGSTTGAGPTASGTPYVVVTAGSPTPSATAGGGYTASASPFPTGYLPTTSPTPTPTPSGLACTSDGFHGINGATVVPGATSATVTWWNPGGSDVVEYRVTAISQEPVVGDQRDIGWTVVTPGDSCGFLTTTVSGLDRQTNYVFSVDAVTTQLDSDGTAAATVARSIVTSTT
ncbi:MAG: fibronectin type III domain-containing protein [Actinoplanes sp.]